MVVDSSTKVIDVSPLSQFQYDYYLTPKLRTRYFFKTISYKYKSRYGLFYKIINLNCENEIMSLFDKSSLDNILLKLTKSSALGETSITLVEESTTIPNG